MIDSESFVTKSAAAKHFGVSKPLITRKSQQGKLVMRDGLVDLVASAGAFGGNGKAVGSVNTNVNRVTEPTIPEARIETETFADAQRRKESALADIRELEHREKLGKLVDVVEMELAWATAGQTLRDALISLPERLAPQLAAITDARQVRDVLYREIRNVVENLPNQIRNVDPTQQAA